ncbi:ABC-type amino acid transport substrate-binding protein [Paraburkholderia youngii]
MNGNLFLMGASMGRRDVSRRGLEVARISRGKDFGFAGNPLYDAKTLGSGTAIGLRKEDTDLQEKIDKAIADIRAGCTYDRIASTWHSRGPTSKLFS